MTKRNRFFVFVVILLTSTAFVHAQNSVLVVDPVTVTVNAADGLALVGDFYALSTDPAEEVPVVLLIHMLGSSRSAWRQFIPPLLDSGYSVLNVDMRGYGATGGGRDWVAAVTDVQTWLDWLREQPGVADDGLSIVGASIGSNLALIGCGNDAQCVTAIALSPGIDYAGVMPESALVDGLAKRSALLVASQNDSYSADSVRYLAGVAVGDVGLRIYPGRAHGTELFATRLDNVRDMTLLWLDEHVPHKEATTSTGS